MVDLMAAKNAFIFPGQGAQYVGMGKDIYEAYEAARQVFDEADEFLGYKLSKLCFEGPEEKLAETEFSQPAILTASMAYLEALRQEAPDIYADYYAGLSLGEYSALTASGMLDFQAALELVARRGRLMQAASVKHPGQMASILGLSLDKVREITDKTDTYIANLNCPNQVVISGLTADIEKAQELAKEAGARRVVILKVSGPFHSAYMDEASRKLSEALDKISLKPAGDKEVVFNVTALPEAEIANIKDNLSRQVNSTTYWQKSIYYLSDKGVNTFFEIGPSQVLKGLMRKINTELRVYNVGSCQDLENLKKELTDA